MAISKDTRTIQEGKRAIYDVARIIGAKPSVDASLHDCAAVIHQRFNKVGRERGVDKYKHPDWWDIRALVEADPNIRAAFLLYDTTDTLGPINSNIFGGTNVRMVTSDGATYNITSANTNHTWDKSKDKPCSDGYKTRYILIYSDTPQVMIKFNLSEVLACQLGNVTVTGLQMTGRGTVFIDITEHSRATATASPMDASTGMSLKYVRVPPGATRTFRIYNCRGIEECYPGDTETTLSDADFVSYGLPRIRLSKSLTTITGRITYNHDGLNTVDLPKSLQSYPANFMSQNVTALRTINIEEGWIVPMDFELSSPVLSVSGLEEFASKMGSRVGMDTVYIICTNVTVLNSIPAYIKDLFAAKNVVFRLTT